MTKLELATKALVEMGMMEKKPAGSQELTTPDAPGKVLEILKQSVANHVIALQVFRERIFKCFAPDRGIDQKIRNMNSIIIKRAYMEGWAAVPSSSRRKKYGKPFGKPMFDGWMRFNNDTASDAVREFAQDFLDTLRKRGAAYEALSKIIPHTNP